MPKTRPARRSEDAPHVERAYRNLKAAIVAGRYRPGASLSEVGLATEHGIVNLKGRSTSERAELLISIAHPAFRDDLEREAKRHQLL